MKNLRFLILALVLALPFGAGLARAQGFVYHAYADTGLKNSVVDSSQFIVPVVPRSGWNPGGIVDTASATRLLNPSLNVTVRSLRGLYQKRSFIKCEWFQIAILSRQSLRNDSTVRVKLWCSNFGWPTSQRANGDQADTVAFMIPTYMGSVVSKYVQYDSLKVYIASGDTLSYSLDMAGNRLVKP